MTPLHVVETLPARRHRCTIIALPGLAESADCLTNTARHWAGRGFRVLAIDPRGHGSSPRWTPQLLSRHPGDVIVEDIIATLEQLPIGAGDRLVLFGHSAGGAAAAAVAAALAAKVDAVVLEDPFWRLPVTPFQDREVASEAAANLRRIKAMTDAERRAEIMAIFPNWPEDELAAWSRSREEMDIALVENGNVIPARAWPSLLEDLAAAHVPVCVITGAIRIGITANHRAIIRSLGADVTVVPGATHFIRRDSRRQFHERVDQFLDERLPIRQR